MLDTVLVFLELIHQRMNFSHEKPRELLSQNEQGLNWILVEGFRPLCSPGLMKDVATLDILG